MAFTVETTGRVYDNLATAVLLFDDQLRLVCVNAAGENLLSVSTRQMEGQTPNEILLGSRNFDRVLKGQRNTILPIQLFCQKIPETKQNYAFFYIKNFMINKLIFSFYYKHCFFTLDQIRSN